MAADKHLDSQDPALIAGNDLAKVNGVKGHEFESNNHKPVIEAGDSETEPIATFVI